MREGPPRGCGDGMREGPRGDGLEGPRRDEGTGCGGVPAGMRGRRAPGEAAPRAVAAAHAPRCPLQPLV